MKTSYFLLTMVSLTSFGQQTKPAISVGTISATAAVTFSINPPSAEAHESLDKGVYTMTFTDPNNEWRCFITGVTPERPGNVIHTEVNSVTIVCVKPHEVPTK